MSQHKKYHKTYHQKSRHPWLKSLVALVVILGGMWLGVGQQSNSFTAFISQISSSLFHSNKSVATDQLAKLDYHSGDPSYVFVNHNKAKLDPNTWKTNKVIYSNLDNFHRTSTGNLAYLESCNVVSDQNRVRQFVEPTAWHQKFMDGQPIINRGHLIAYSISGGISSSGKYNPTDTSGDQNNPKNLFTQTSFSNQQVQTIFESKVRESLRRGNKVIFFAKPIFRGNELMARGIHLEAISTNKSLNFNVYLFNVQPNIQFDYSTGRSHIDRNMKVPEP
ncbi:DNA/RNA non-specific endonuclease [Lentilactobacillus kefiri]|uniref:DNA RNA non-specific endonuclease n=2 Tax=Lentilactobacillus kefiri TaxID=33962 RepID=A0A8E1V2M9_LENKE|nr:DNA/RNA non-specific endonuclease [Lentilactobacillus kefiri]KRL71194.1 DNA RNA non-specific endonuclease [Lentilactobacillus parakefiri DSM 10551]KRM53588.1 DNA RNA non-specific endonuclease [Lentilactobacillus kefiri DSM 20587 = JCM 5818]MCJ2161826.1 DNA/RNA non-specific endonuclease [Lentilactobacillus kefiri]MCP9369932.1 DNA/RNA non-specific endonuclease [Lentilactobacillus kefiri]MDH5108565.1 DNA/RNA non-specific endonuclease [Lentilactobacillus kefiri]